jgi:hypothetical protein
VLFRRFPVPGLLVLLVAGAGGCSTPGATASLERADVAVRSYAPPSGAPGFCTALAGSTHLTDVPSAVGTLTADPEDIEAGLALTAVIGELTDVLDGVRAHPGFLELGRSLEQLAGALREAREGPLTDAVRTAITTALDDVGRQVQPVCGFPA